MRFPKAPPETDFSPLLAGDPEVLQRVSPTLADGRYLHWDELRYRTPPDGLTLHEWWSRLKWARTQKYTQIYSMKDLYRLQFGLCQLPAIQATLHDFDRRNVERELIAALGNNDALTEYRVRQLIEEAISSSILEGAKPTTREIARQLVREGRTPTNRDERMILNNWRAMKRILELRDENRPLVVDDMLELHRILGDDALEVPRAEGMFRGPEHNVTVSDIDGEVWHQPPPAYGLQDRIATLLRFADGNTLDGSGEFIHPVLRAIIVHFWVGYEHPFRDGNGRIARALYYWCMLRHGYEMAEFLSISGPIDRKPTDYYMAYAHTETDGGDLTYFVLHQLHVMRQAITELNEHLKQRAQRMALYAQTVAGFANLNHRQRALLQHAIRHSFESYTIDGHAASHHVHYHTAQADLAELVKQDYLEAYRTSTGKRFRPAKALAKKLGVGDK